MPEHEDSTRTVVVAAAANLGIAAAKAVAALLTGSAALWAETLHSLADTGNEVLLWLGLRRSKRGADRRHPFGYGQERFFWAFLAALGIFLVGGLLSVAEGVRSLLVPEPLQSPWIGIAVLVVSAAFEGYSWRTARRQLRRDAARRRRSVREHLALASDPSATTVYLEDTAALVGIGLALLALILHMVTGWAWWDAAASMAIGVLLAVVAWLLARRSKTLLIDAAAPEDVMQRLREAMGPQPWIREVHEFRAVYVGPSQLLVTLGVEPRAELGERPGAELLDRVGDLRERLRGSPAVADAVVTLVPPRP
ncbi:cation diffusion facilitator family transporter [Dactylosporangium sp. CA-139066]|uniref:cation diffusion facilitator family transporter n=1 Tax=Dactylosporangium sp. CA-139066 TaxID=3239930 RepID=UPI003D8FF414